NDSVYFGLDSIGAGKFRDGHDDLQVFVANWQHRFSERLHTMTEGYFIWQRDALTGGTVINGPPRSFFTAVGPGTPLPGISPVLGLVNYTNLMLSPRDYITVRNDIMDDFRGERTGFRTLYSEHTIGWCHYLTPEITMRPEVRFDHSYHVP